MYSESNMFLLENRYNENENLNNRQHLILLLSNLV